MTPRTAYGCLLSRLREWDPLSEDPLSEDPDDSDDSDSELMTPTPSPTNSSELDELELSSELELSRTRRHRQIGIRAEELLLLELLLKLLDELLSVDVGNVMLMFRGALEVL